MSDTQRPSFTRRAQTEAEAAHLARLDDLGDQMITELHAIGGTDPEGSELASQALAFAAQMTRQAIDQAKRHLTA